MNWHKHIDYVKTKILPFIHVIYRIRKFVSRDGLWQIYHAYVLSHLQYLNQIWSNTGTTKLKEIQRIQNKIIKTILFKHRLTHEKERRLSDKNK